MHNKCVCTLNMRAELTTPVVLQANVKPKPPDITLCILSLTIFFLVIVSSVIPSGPWAGGATGGWYAWTTGGSTGSCFSAISSPAASGASPPPSFLQHIVNIPLAATGATAGSASSAIMASFLYDPLFKSDAIFYCKSELHKVSENLDIWSFLYTYSIIPTAWVTRNSSKFSDGRVFFMYLLYYSPNVRVQVRTPRWPCQACAAQPAREERTSSKGRPIQIPDITCKLAERAGCFEQKQALAEAFLTPEFQQTGVAVPGGLTSFCLSIEADLRQDLEKRSLALDIFNMFNEACRLATEEDLERSLELLGVDLSMMSLYVHIAHNCA
eukprot:SAG11_NODE_991_length_6262_cov_12.112607_1_plen_326_part_00